MAHTERGHTEQFALQPEQVAIAATQVQQRSDTESFLQHCADREIADSQNGQRVVSEGDRVAASLDESLCADKEFFQDQRLWRIQFANDYAFPILDLVEQAFFRLCLL